MRLMLVASIATACAIGCLEPKHATAADAALDQTGIASVYSTNSGSRTASGKKLNPTALTAAHRTLPFGTNVLVTNKKNGRSVIVTINDRGPFRRGPGDRCDTGRGSRFGLLGAGAGGAQEGA